MAGFYPLGLQAERAVSQPAVRRQSTARTETPPESRWNSARYPPSRTHRTLSIRRWLDRACQRWPIRDEGCPKKFSLSETELFVSVALWFTYTQTVIWRNYRGTQTRGVFGAELTADFVFLPYQFQSSGKIPVDLQRVRKIDRMRYIYICIERERWLGWLVLCLGRRSLAGVKILCRDSNLAHESFNNRA